MSSNKKKTFNSVSAMLNECAGDDAALSAEFEQYMAERKLVKDLAILRSSHGLSQEELATKLQRSQSWVSKLEHGTDDDLRLGDLKAYMSALGLEFRPGAVKKGATLVDEIKMLSFAMREKLMRLAESAKEGDGLLGPVLSVFCSTFCNINKFLSQAAAKLPLGPDMKPFISIVAMVEQMNSFEKEEEQVKKASLVCECQRLAKEPAIN